MNKKLIGIFVITLLIATTLQIFVNVSQSKLNLVDKQEDKMLYRIKNELIQYQIYFDEINSLVTDRTEQLDQEQVDSSMDSGPIYDNFQLGQSFTPSFNTLTRVELILRKTNPNHETRKIKVQIGEPSMLFLPIVEVITDVTINDKKNWIEFDFENIKVIPGKQYFICLKCLDCYDDADAINWCRSETDAYSGGEAWYNYYSYITWIWTWVKYLQEEQFDFTFRTYGIDNEPPENPYKLNGPTIVNVDKKYIYSSYSSDTDGDKVRLCFDHGDGTQSWSDYVDSGELAEVEISWNTAGSKQIKVKAQDIWGAESDWFNAFTIKAGNLDIQSVKPIQFIDGAPCPLIKDKGTIFKVTVVNSIIDNLDTYFCLDLPDSEWYFIPDIDPLNPLSVSNDWRPDDVWGPVKLKFGVNEILLPIVQNGKENDAFDPISNPAGIIYGGIDNLYQYPDVRVVPRPEKSIVSYIISVDPNKEYACTEEEGSWYIDGEWQTVTTGEYKIGYWRINGGNTQAYGEPANDGDTSNYVDDNGNEIPCPEPDGKCWDADEPNCPDDNPSWESVNDRIKTSVEYLLGVYPIADSKIMFKCEGEIYWDWPKIKRREFLNDLYTRSTISGDDWGVGIDCGCCGGCVSQSIYLSVFIGNFTGDEYIHNLAHEFGHVLTGEPDCYKCKNCNTVPEDENPPDCDSCKTEYDGFWVNRWNSYPIGSWTFMYFAGRSDVWVKWQPTEHCKGCYYLGGFQAMLSKLEDLNDPEGLLIRGMINKNNTVRFDSFIRLANTKIDIESGDIGDYYIVLKNTENDIIGKYGFTPSFMETGYQPDWDDIETDEAFFSFVIDWHEDIKSIELQNKNGTILASRTISANDPEVTIKSPRNGQVIRKSEILTVEWEANDLDGDELSFALLFSNGGEEWITLDIDITENEYEIDTNNVGIGEGKDCFIKVIVSDGVNTAEDISGPFSLPKAKTTNSLILKLLEKYLDLFPILRHMLDL